jgi:general secretion pathway protein A
MYFEHFGLARPPFLSQPSSDALFMGAGHREGLAALEWGLEEPSGFTLLTGEVGTGKTTLIAALMAKCGAGRRIVRIWNPHLSLDEMLREGLGQLGLSPSASAAGRLGLFNDLMRACEEQRLVMIFDEAQELGAELLEDLRLLSNALSHQERAIQIILVGQPELVTRLAHSSLRQLNQRIGARANLRALGAAEVLDYTDCRIRAAGGSLDRVCSRTGRRALIRHSHGIPRRINILCHNAMMIACLAGARQIDARHVNEAACEYDQWRVQHAGESMSEYWLRIAKLRWIGAAAVLVGVLWITFPLVRGLRFREAPTSTALHRQTRDLDSRIAALQTSVVSADARPPAVSSDREKTASNVNLVPAVLSTIATAPAVARAATVRPANAPTRTTPPARLAHSARQREVIVRPGDSLSTIAREHLGSVYDLQRLVDANPNIRDPNLIYAGQKIRLGGK